MTDPIVAALTLAGFLVAQVADVATQNPDKSLSPVALVAENAQQQFQFFPGNTLEEMVDHGRRELAARPGTSWAFAYEGYVLIEGKKEPALFVEASSKGMAKPVTLIQLWKRDDNHKVQLLGPPRKYSGQIPLPGSHPKPPIFADLSTQEIDAFAAGFLQREKLKQQGVFDAPKH